MPQGGVDVFGIGQCSLDYLGRIAHYPSSDSKCEFNDLTVAGGGPVATALVALNRWGHTSAIAGIIGDDRFGREIRESLTAEGVETGGLIIRPGSQSQFAFIVAEAPGGERTVFWRRPTGKPLESGELDIGSIRRSKVLLTDGLYPQAAIAAATAARSAGVPVVIDAGSMREGMDELLPLSNYFLASETFAEAYAPGANPLEVCEKLSQAGPSVTGVTLGARGCAASVNGRLMELPAYPVDAIDTTGCGDIFHAGFIHGLLQDWNTDSCFDFAVWSAAMVARKLGGRDAIPVPEDWPRRR